MEEYTFTYFNKSQKKELKELIDKDLLIGLVDIKEDLIIGYFNKLHRNRLDRLICKTKV